MSSLIFPCPLPTALSDIDKQTCPEKWGQIQKMALRLTQDPAESSPTFETIADLSVESNWTAALAASDTKKIVITPFIASVVLPPSTPITEEGNNNNTVNGIEILEGANNVAATGRWLNLTDAIAEQLRSLTPFSALMPGFTSLEAFFFTENGSIIYNKLSAAATIPKGTDIYNWFVSSASTEGLNKPNVHNLSFTLLGNWDQYVGIVKPTNFNPLNLG